MVKININDEVVLWNGTVGNVSEKNLEDFTIVVTCDNGYPIEAHKMNIRFLNGEEVSAEETLL